MWSTEYWTHYCHIIYPLQCLRAVSSNLSFDLDSSFSFCNSLLAIVNDFVTPSSLPLRIILALPVFKSCFKILGFYLNDSFILSIIMSAVTLTLSSPY
nr:MAG TPA: hypothetical protein [Crassvirales sp.]